MVRLKKEVKAVSAKKLLGERIKNARAGAGYTQEEFAKKVGLPKITIARYETGVYEPSTDRLQKIAACLNKPVSYFFGEEPNPYLIIEGLRQENLHLREELAEYKKRG